MRRDTVTIGHKTLSYLVADPSGQTIRQRPVSTLVVLHAFPLQSTMWESTLGSVPEGWRAVAPDCRGDAGIGMNDLAGDVVDLLDHLGVAHAAVFGCSMGGYVLFELLRSAPSYLSAIGLVSTRAGADNEEGRNNRRKMIDLAERDGVEAVAAQMVPKLLGPSTQRDRPDLVKQVRHLILSNDTGRVKSAITAMMGRPDSTPVLSRIDVPTLVVHGVEDALIPPSEAEAMHRAIKHSRLELIPSSGHLPNLEQPVAFDGVLWPFLNTL